MEVGIICILQVSKLRQKSWGAFPRSHSQQGAGSQTQAV